MASFRKLPSGNTRAEVSRQGKRVSKVFPTKQAAKEWAARQEFLILDAVDKPVDHGTFGQAMDRYAREVSPTKRGEWWEVLKLGNFCKDPIAETNMAKLTPEMFAKWRDKRSTQVKPATVAREMQLMSAVLTCARREWGMIAVNPMSDVRRPKKPESRDRLPTADELLRLSHAAGDDLTTATARAFHAFKFALETAMRSGEIVALTRDHIDLKRRVAKLTHTKNGRSREVPLSSEAVRLIEALPQDLDPVFGLDNRMIDVLWRKVRDKAQADGLNFHDSRHAAITRLSTKLDVLALARMVGHSDLRMLQVYYNESAENLAKRLD